MWYTWTAMLNAATLFGYAVEKNASDLHLLVGHKPILRISGELYDLDKEQVMSELEMERVIKQIVTPEQFDRFVREKELDLAYALGSARFRVNLHWEKSHIGMAARTIPQVIPTMEQLGLTDVARSFTELPNGLVLVTGPTGAGKSTTLASMIDHVNANRRENIITLEDPIEFLFEAKQSIIRQRQLESDMVTFGEGLKHVLRQDPDVVMVGEMRDLDTIATTLTLAETGHLVFATLHTQDAPQTIDRIVDVFPTNQQEQVRAMLGAALEGVVTQQLIPNSDGTGRVAACEVMVCTAAIRNLIRSAKTHQIYSIMQTGGQYGMQTMDQALARMVREGKITEGVAFDRCRNEEDLRNHLNS